MVLPCPNSSASAPITHPPCSPSSKENRTYFATSVPDRGDAYFTDFAAQLTARLTEQAAGICHFHLLVDPDGEVLGRFNLVDIADGSADLGFRVAEKATRRGLATATVLHLCTLAATEYGLTTLRAAAALDNTASRTVLTRAGFVPTGEEVRLSGRPGLGYVRDLSRDPEDGAR